MRLFSLEKMNWAKDYKKNLREIAFLVPLSLVFIELFASYLLEFYEHLNLLLLSLTAILLYWYSKETFDLKIQGIKALRSSIQPILVPYKANGSTLFIKNSGRGIAKDITWKCVDDTIKLVSKPQCINGFVEPLAGGINDYVVAKQSLVSIQISYTGSGSIRLEYANERNEKYYSDIEITESGISRLIKTDSVRALNKKR